MGSEEFIAASFIAPPKGDDPGNFGCNPFGSSGEDPVSWKRKLDSAVRFFSETAKNLFPAYALDQAFQDKFMKTFMTVSAYRNEMNYWMHCDERHVALGHGNMNVDNVWFWRNENDDLECGVFDWGGFGTGPIGHRIWWCIYAEDFDCVMANLDDFLDCYIQVYTDG